MEITVTTENGRVPVTIIHVEGNLDSATYQSFQAKADELIKAGARFLLIDFTRAPYISSAGLRALHALFVALGKLHPEENITDEKMRKEIFAGSYKSPYLKLLNLSKEAEIAFKLGGFDLYIETFTDHKKAVASF